MVNKVIIQGRLTRDPEVTEAGGFKKGVITVAWSEKYKETEKVCFLDCIAWRSSAEFLEKYFKKGQEIVIEGQLATNSWEKDGQKYSRIVCNIEKINFCGSKGSGSSDHQEKSNDGFMTFPDGAEELPFN